MRKIADEVGRSPAQVAINWVRQQQDKSQIIPVLGARSEMQMQDNLACLEFELSEEHLELLGNASPIELGFPRSFLESENVKNLVFGKTYELIDHHRAI